MTDPKEGLLDLGVAEVMDNMNAPALETAQPLASGSVRRYGYIPKEKFENINKGKGIRFHRLFTKPGIDPFDTIEWEKRTAIISGERGEVVFEQKDVEVPVYWSQLATNVVASKYFRGQVGTPERERSVKQLIGRVVNTLASWGLERSYFATAEDAEIFREELKHLLLYQYAAFNSPVWFNVGIEPRPQCSACQPYHAMVNTLRGPMPIGEIVEKGLIGLPVYDDEGLTPVVAVKHNGRKPVYRITLNDGFSIEATGDHLVCAHSTRRTCRFEWHRVENLEPKMWMRVYANSPRTYLPDGDEQTVSEAALAGWLQADGFVGQYPNGTNRSLTIEFMTVGQEEFNWVISHLKRVFPDQHIHTREVETHSSKEQCLRIRLYGEQLRPFVEKYELLQRGTEIRVPNPIWTAPNNVAAAYLKSLFQADGYAAIHHPSAHIAFAVVSRRWAEGVQLLLTRLGIYSRVRQKRENRPDRYDLWEVDISIASERKKFEEQINFISERKQSKLKGSLQVKGKSCPEVRYQQIRCIEPVGEMDVYDIQTLSGRYLSNSVLVHNCFIVSVEDTMESILDLAKTEGMIFKFGSGSGSNLSGIRGSREHLSGGGHASGPVSFMRGFDSFAGVIKSGGKTRRAAKMVVLNDDHPDIVDFIECKAREEQKAWALIEEGYDPGFNVPGGAYDSVFFQNANHSVRVSDAFMRAVEQNSDWETHARTDGRIMGRYKARDLFRKIAESAWICGDPGLQFHDTTNKWHTCSNTAPINASNPCSEYVFLDDSACNLASMNLMKFRKENGEFDIETYRHAVRTLITAQEIIVDNSTYPTEKISDNSHKYRPLGLGYANLGALLMSLGLPYDSDEGRAYAAVLTAIMHGEANRQSAIIARDCGSPFPDYEINREPMLKVMQMHAEHVDHIDPRLVPGDLLKAAKDIWTDVLKIGEKSGFRNAQVTVIAPTGCLVGHSLIATEYGLVRLHTLGNPNGSQWQDVDFTVMTDEGVQTATKFYVNGHAPTRIIRTHSGYTLQGTPNHQVKVIDPETGERVWRALDAIHPGDIVPLQMNTLTGTAHEVALPPMGDLYWSADHETRAPRTMTPELAELIGYYMGDGSLHAKGMRFCVNQEDTDVVDRIRSLCRTVFGLNAKTTQHQGYTEVSIYSVPLTIWWEACGFAKHKPNDEHTGKGFVPHIPDAVLYTNDPLIYTAFLRGLFEADGTVITGVPSLSTSSEAFAQEVRSLLLALGYPTQAKLDTSAWGQGTLYGLRLRNQSYNEAFLREIGFMGQRKRDAIIRDTSKMTGKNDLIYLPQSLVRELVPRTSRHYGAIRLSLKRRSGIPRQRVQMLFKETADPRLAEALQFYYDKVETNEDGDIQPTYDLSVPANVTYIANGFISHNTISFFMDCDTTGIEPDIALVKYKSLVGGGMLKMVNNTLPMALRRLGYSQEQIEDILAYVDLHDTIEGAPHLQEEHLPIFDCAFRPSNGKRSIQPMGHVKMMAAAQPFLSGAISKTVNMPADTTPADIEDIYLQAWKLGLKAIAIYRDGSKRTQPLSTKKPSEQAESQGTPANAEAAPAEAAAAVTQPTRKHLANERRSITHKFSIAGHEGYITVGMYDDGSPGEIFITMAKEGSVISGLMDAFATAISLALQYGVPLEKLAEKFSYTRFQPSGFTNNPQIPVATSIVDYIFRWLRLKFLPATQENQPPSLTPEPLATTATDALTREMAGLEGGAASETTNPPGETASIPTTGQGVTTDWSKLVALQTDAPPCPVCGMIMVRSGACHQCLNCGTSYGCG